jgi:cobalamin biosynthesis protein CobT
VRLWDTQTKRRLTIGRFASEEDAARAYDRAAVQLGSDAKLNFPGGTISEPPVSSGGGCRKVSAKRGRQEQSESESESDQQSESEEEEQSEQQSEEEQSESEEEQQSEEEQDGSEEEQDGSEEQQSEIWCDEIQQLLMAASEKASIVAAMKQ